MREVNPVSVPKWPFLIGDAALLATAGYIFFNTPPPLGLWELVAGCICVAFGAVLGVWPFVLQHGGTVKQMDALALGATTDKLQNLERIAGQISAATNDWQTVHLQSEKTSNAAREIVERITNEARAFTEFLQKANDNEKATLRLEVDKLRRVEGEWLQVLVRILDHAHALHAGAVRSGQPRMVEPIQQFLGACHDSARRVGLTPFAAKPGEAFDSQRHQTLDGEAPAAGATVAETVAAGFTFQGRLVRAVLVRIGEAPAPENASATAESAPASTPAPAAAEGEDQSQLPLAAS